MAKLDASISVNEYIKKEDWRVSENSNAHYSFGALNKYLSSKISALFWLEDVYNEEIASAHNNGFMHIHDLGSISPYCAGYSLTDIIKKGVRGVSNIPVSSPAKHFMSLLNQVANLTTVFQNELAGAVAFSSFDTLCAPFVKVDGLDYDEVYQHMQNFIFSINSNSRGGAEPAFSNLTFDLTPPKDLLNKKAIVGGEEQPFTYKDCQKEMDMINKAFFEIMIKGDSEGAPFSYPIPTYNIHERFDWNNKNNELLWVMTGKFGTPYFANFINSDMDPGESRSMAILGTQNVIYINELGKIAKNEIRHLVSNWIKAEKDFKPKYKILMNGNFIDIIDMFEVPYEKYDKFVTVKLQNGYNQSFSYQHKCPIVRDGKFMEVESQQLEKGDSFLVSIKGYEGSKIGNYNSGKILGYFLGEGWISQHSNSEINFAINIDRKDIVDEIERFFQEIACEVRVEEQPEINIFKVYVYGKQAVGFVNQYIRGTTAKTKRLESKIWNSSLDFRKGVLEGLYDTDGYKKEKILFHTTNKELCSDLIALASSVGMILKYRVNDKNTRYFSKDKSDLETFTSYELKIWDNFPTGEVFGETFALVPVEEVCTPDSRSDVVYNFTVDTPEHLYELPNGIVTHQCCRLKIDLRELRRRGGGLFGSGELTGSIGVVTLNLPRLAYLSSKKYDNVESAKKDFFIELEKYMNIAKESLELKRAFLEKQLEVGLFPAFKEYVGHLENHFSTIGLVGMNEMCLNLLGTGIKDDEGKQFSLEVLDFMRDKIADFQEETGNLYNLEATPAESCLAGETKIKTVEYGDEEIKNLVGKEFGVWSYDADSKEVCIKRGHSVRKTQENAKVMELILDNGESLILTPNHPIAVNRPNRWGLPTINWVEARDLKPGNSIKSLYFTQAGENGYVMVNGAQKRANILSEWYEQRPIDSSEREIAENFNCTTGLVQSRLKSVGLNHKVVSIREIDTLIDVYNMEVDDTECYFVDDNKGNGILVHNCSYRLAKIDVGEFGEDIITQGNTNGFAPYYTNSCHLPVSEVEDILQVISHQEELQEKFTGGTVVHLYTQNSMSGDMAKHIIRTICENYKVPYVSISPVYSICPDHNFIEGNQPICPHCGKETEQYQRITGYIRQVSKFNPGKKAEFADRHQLIPKL